MPIAPRTASLSLVIAGLAIHTFAAPHLASADWPQFGRPICTAPAAQVHSSIATDGAGGAIITWQDFRFPRINIFAQHVLSTGEVDAAWPTNGRALLTDPLAMATADGGQTSPLIVSDGAGGAVVAWQDNRSPVTETDVFAQHVLASGAVDGAWPANGTALSATLGLQNTIVMASDGAGGAIVAWLDTRPGASVRDVYAQRVLASGLVDSRWPTNGLAVCTAPGAQGSPVILADGAGGAIVAWQDPRSTTTGSDIYAQHVLSSGVVDPAWPVDGRAVCTASGDQGGPTVASDGAGGAIVAWSDSRIVGTSHIFADHVLGSGVVDPAWPANGRALSGPNLLESRPLAVSDGTGGAIVTWQGFTVHLNMFAQHVTASGVVDPAWPAGGRALSIVKRQLDFADIVPDGAGGAVVAWDDTFNIVAQHVLASGGLDPAYPDTGLAVVDLPSTQGDPALVASPGGGAIVSWTDGRSGVDLDIYAMEVLAARPTDVSNSAPPGIAFARPGPNPARGPLTLRFALPRQTRLSLVIYDVAGRRVRELASGARPAGEQSIAWDLRDERGKTVRAGLYFARLEADGHSFTQKVATLE